MAENENIRIIKDAYAAFGRGDIPALLAMLTNDVKWYLPGPSSVPAAGTYVGPAQVAEFFTKLGQSDEVLAFEPRSYFADGNTVVVIGRYSARVRATGRTTDFEWVHVFTMRDACVAGWEEFYDTLEVSKAYQTERAAVT